MDPFTSKAIFELKETSLPGESVWHGFKLDADLRSESLHLAEVEEIKIPDLKSDFLRLSIDNESLDRIDLLSATSSRSGSDEDPHFEEEPGHGSETDIWDATDLSRRQPKHGLLDWDRFDGNHNNSLGPRYLSEAGETAYDAVVSHGWRMKNREPLRYALLDRFRQAVLNVLLGRGSLVFEWNESTQSFETQLDKIALAGHSAQLTATLCNRVCACGTSFRTIQAFCQSYKPTNPTTFAAQSSLLQILNAIETDLLQVAAARPTVVRLQNVSSKYAELYKTLQPIVVATQSLEQESYVLAAAIRHINEVWASNTPLRPVLTELADRILQPSIRDTCKQIETGIIASGMITNTGWVLAGLLPDLESMFQDTLKCIRVGNGNGIWIRQLSNGATSLQLAHQWSDIVTIQCQADLLELESWKKPENPFYSTEVPIEQYTHAEKTHLNIHNPFDLNLQTSPRNFIALQQHSEKDSRLSKLVLAMLMNEETKSEPELSPLQMLDMSLRPILSVQHRICSYTLMKCLFLQHGLVAHLDLLYAFQLFGNGLFVTRLSRALFDTAQYSAEGRRNTGLTAGLRLEDREIWPPASSELRFVLMGLLSELPNAHDSRDLLESISFAIRDLSDEDMELCRDVHSVHALDFLRLVYAPPNSVLELIITSSVLEKYDRIFKFLLVLLRMHAFSQSLMIAVVCRSAEPRPNKQQHRFCLQLHYFAANFLDYALNVAINMPWQRMLQCFKAVHDSLQAEDYDRCMSVAGSISQLCKVHEDALDEILVALFLKKTQLKPFAATCEIFRIGLDFARNDDVNDLKQNPSVYFRELRRALDDWVSLVSKTKSAGHDREFRAIDHLLDKFEHSRY